MGAIIGYSILFGFLLGMAIGMYKGEKQIHPNKFTESPYCESVKLQEQTYTRCWKTIEVKP